ncbi:HAMP domain-containing sensor histidine kinase [Pseudoalteromonas sp. MMG005]|uniref:sensor histidine kinase n=1 Tax=Pseudoalteromonas sp. MMG005 TaxID=2822682 RepID=UPI001B3A11F4|nr:HAMP domain-containing sensor histidine kinase [Pseudoalteromonas sp. MMG005]MBQ4848322.1 HAMP domain-containing histidine kinase [Pseudoalteromonas sp. MMG005]
MTEHIAKQTAQSIAERTKRQLISIAIVLFITCLAFVIIFVIYVVDATTDSYLRLEANSVINQINVNKNIKLPQRKEFSAYRSWQQIPIDIRQLFDKNKLKLMSPVTIERTSELGQRDYVYILYSKVKDYGDIYFTGVEDAKNADQFLTPLFTNAFIHALILTVILFSALYFVISWILRRALEPLTALVAWSKKIQDNPKEDIYLDFSISELNQIADQLMTNIKQMNALNERERLFLKHASHELRTPLATIQASLDTINLRIKVSDANHPSLTRALRASNNMINLSDTLLWLARESNKKIPKKQISIRQCCKEIIQFQSYLLKGKPVTTELSQTDHTVDIEDELLRIILSNVIRNAFQHSFAGTVSINLYEDHIIISNLVNTNEESDTQCFGLGLQLVEKIALKINWHFNFAIKNNIATVIINWQTRQ